MDRGAQGVCESGCRAAPHPPGVRHGSRVRLPRSLCPATRTRTGHRAAGARPARPGCWPGRPGRKTAKKTARRPARSSRGCEVPPSVAGAPSTCRGRARAGKPVSSARSPKIPAGRRSSCSATGGSRCRKPARNPIRLWALHAREESPPANAERIELVPSDHAAGDRCRGCGPSAEMVRPSAGASRTSSASSSPAARSRNSSTAPPHASSAPSPSGWSSHGASS